MKWRSVTGLLCDNSIPYRYKSKVYRMVVRALYDAECWASSKEAERQLILQVQVRAVPLRLQISRCLTSQTGVGETIVMVNS
ncbi:hypothetical protein Y032_0047g1460 [Ancylostoma ceylanicum]|uniref:Uncharacterized protein n=1 Tax=Ancylostoma ceylanicum TaxID=53326 RepID=A0A016UBS7_9BILA|nr:hypothetical protein Y032_0047g1460 [Ancylostoma ceylanicum]